MSVELIINGEKRRFSPAGTKQLSLSELLVCHLNYPASGQGYVVAVDGSLVAIENWSETVLKGGEVIDVLGAITGG